MQPTASYKSSIRRLIMAWGLVVSLGGSFNLTNSNLSFGQTFYTPNASGSTFQPGYGGSPTPETPQTNLTPIAPPATTYTPPANTYGSFDPYATTPGSGMGGVPGTTTLGPPAGTYPPPASSDGSFFGLFTSPTMSPAGYGAQPMTPMDNPPIYGSAPTATPAPNGIYGPPTAFPNSAYPQSVPNTLFPEGFGPIYSGPLFQTPPDAYSAFRLLQGPRFRYTYVGPGSKPYNVGINDFDFSVACAFPNFLYTTQPFYVVPSFSLHLWDGPNGSTGADLPPNAYSAFVDLGWESDPNKLVGTEFGLRLGVFTDFNTYNSKSFRVRGRALFNFRLTPTSTFKGGLYYVNRNEIKLVPAAGFFCRPNPQTRIDLYFPQPKYARFCRTLGTYDLWWYVTGDYGGGNWTIERDDGYDDQVDINDLRAILGFEWGPSQTLQLGRRTAFAEIAYVFEREVRYRYSPQDDFDPSNSFAFRIGIGY